MSVNNGIPKRFQLGGVEYDASGDWTVMVSRNKKEEAEITRKDNYYKDVPMPGKITGQVAIRTDQEFNTLLNADSTPFLLEDAAGRLFSGEVTYIADGEQNLGDGTISVELSGRVEEQ